jgi:hypothetical protein
MYSEQMFEECEASSVHSILLSVGYVVCIALFPSLILLFGVSPWTHLTLSVVATYTWHIVT